MTTDFRDETNLHRPQLEFVLVTFVNFPHILLTYSILSFPEIRTAIREHTSDIRAAFVIRLALACVFAIWLATCDLGTVLVKSTLTNLTLAIGGALSFQHGISQISGICSAYDQQLLEKKSFTGRDRRQFDLMRRFERIGFTILTPSFCCYYALDFISRQIYPNLLSATRCAVLISILGLALNVIWRLLRFRDFEKSIYITRVGMFGFYVSGILSDHVAIMYVALHGLEYMGIYNRMSGNSAISRRALRAIHIAMGVLFIIFLPVLFVTHKSAFNSVVPQALPAWILVLVFTVACLEVLHYCLDRVVFRMRFAPIRTHVGPLLIAGNRGRRSEHVLIERQPTQTTRTTG